MTKIISIGISTSTKPLLEDGKEQGFKRLSFDGINPKLLKNPVLKMLYKEDSHLLTGRRCPIAPKDEWVIFLD